MRELSGDLLYTSGAPGPFSGPLPGASQRRLQSVVGRTTQRPEYSQLQTLNSIPVDAIFNEWNLEPTLSDGDAWSESAGLAEIPRTGMHTDSRNECKELCFSIPGCKAVTYNKESKRCWIHSPQEVHNGKPSELAGDTLHAYHDAYLQLLGLPSTGRAAFALCMSCACTLGVSALNAIGCTIVLHMAPDAVLLLGHPAYRIKNCALCRLWGVV